MNLPTDSPQPMLRHDADLPADSQPPLPGIASMTGLGAPASKLGPSPPPDASGLPSSAELVLQGLEREATGDRKRFLRAASIAVLVHIVLLVITWPEWGDKPLKASKPGKVYVMQQVRFEKPPARAQKQQEVPKRKTRKIPIPDPTPDDPEPIEIEEIEIPELDQQIADTAIFGIPDGPDPGTGSASDGAFDGALAVGGGIAKPKWLSRPEPRFPEPARQARIQGVVLLKILVDEKGDVTTVEVVKGLPMGLSESAVEMVKTWKAEPALRDGQPVPVFFFLTVGFWLQ